MSALLHEVGIKLDQPTGAYLIGLACSGAAGETVVVRRTLTALFELDRALASEVPWNNTVVTRIEMGGYVFTGSWAPAVTWRPPRRVIGLPGDELVAHVFFRRAGAWNGAFFSRASRASSG